MTGKTHRLVGITAGLSYYFAATTPQYQPATFGTVIAGSYLGSLAPDIDDAGADIWHTVPLGHTVGKIADPILKHRNISHSLVGLALYTIIVYAILAALPSYWGIATWPVLISSAVAYASHLLADAFTVEGIPVLWPWKRNFGLPPKPFDGIRIETGHWFENLVIFPAVNIILIVIIMINWDNIKRVLLK